MNNEKLKYSDLSDIERVKDLVNSSAGRTFTIEQIYNRLNIPLGIISKALAEIPGSVEREGKGLSGTVSIVDDPHEPIGEARLNVVSIANRTAPNPNPTNNLNAGGAKKVTSTNSSEFDSGK